MVLPSGHDARLAVRDDCEPALDLSDHGLLPGQQGEHVIRVGPIIDAHARMERQSPEHLPELGSAVEVATLAARVDEMQPGTAIEQTAQLCRRLSPSRYPSVQPSRIAREG